MAKASSSKKVARAARVGSSSKGPERRSLGFPLAVAAIVLLGSSLVLYARSDDSAAGGAPQIGEHWHAAYGIYNCDKWEAPVADNGIDPHGIHTHDDDNGVDGGVMHVHPYDSSVTGSRATLGAFFDTVGIKASNDKITFPNGVELVDGAMCGDKPGVLQILRWNTADATAKPEVTTKNFSSMRYRSDREAFTIALAPEGAISPRPTSIAALDTLSDVGVPVDPGAGATGASGVTGESGQSGSTGDVGATGSTGDVGATGSTGGRGSSGESGVTTTTAP